MTRTLGVFFLGLILGCLVTLVGAIVGTQMGLREVRRMVGAGELRCRP